MTQIAANRPDTRIGLAVCLFGLPEIVTVVRGAGYDLVVIDMEHGRIGIGALTSICVTALQTGFPVLARVTGPRSPDLARVLDCGATGILVPHVDSVAQAQAVVATCRFAPLGQRAIPGPLALTGFRSVPPRELIEMAERDVQILAMIESLDGLDAVEEIAAVPGIDALVIGANDLAAALGHTGDLPHSDVARAIARVADACHAAGKAFGVMGLPPSLLPAYAIDQGANLIVATNEINLLVDGAHDMLARVRAATTLAPNASRPDVPA